MRTVKATRYVTPLKEGGSLPAIIEADDDGMYVLKFRGAGQGVKALIAELLAGEIGRAIGLPVPEIVFVELDSALSKSEPDPEIRDLINASGGLNIALDYLPGSTAFDPVLHTIDAVLASSLVWFDAFITNVDRTVRNTNMLMWHKKLWLIDHGAALYFHHSWDGYLEKSSTPFKMIKDHVLLKYASAIEEADKKLKAQLSPYKIMDIAALIPNEWLEAEGYFSNSEEHRKAYVDYLIARLKSTHNFTEEVIRARSLHI